MKQRLFLMQSLWICLGILLTLWFGPKNVMGLFLPGPDTPPSVERFALIVTTWWPLLEFAWLLLFSCLLIRSWGDVVFNLTLAVIGFVVWFITHVLLDVESMQLRFQSFSVIIPLGMAAALLFVCPFPAWMGRSAADWGVLLEKMYWRQFGIYLIFPIWAFAAMFHPAVSTVCAICGLLFYGWYLDKRFTASLKAEDDKSTVHAGG